MVKKTAAGTYEVDFRGPRCNCGKIQGYHRHRMLKTFRKHRDAIRFHDEIKTKVRSGEYVAPSKKTVAEGAEMPLERERGRLKAQSYQQRETHVRKYIIPSIGAVPMTGLTWEEIEKKSHDWQVAAVTVNKIFETLGRIYTVIGKKVGVRINPMSQVDRAKDDKSLEQIEAEATGEVIVCDDDFSEVGVIRKIRPDEVYSAEEVKKLIEASAPGLDRIRHMLACYTGVRHGELNGLQWKYINLDTGKINIRRSLTELPRQFALERPKSKAAYRTIKMGTVLQKELRLWKLQCPVSEWDLVLCNEKGQPANRKTNNRILKRTAESAKIRPLSMNNLRHTFASQSLAARVEPLEVSKLMGHNNVQTTLTIYAQWCEREKSQAAALLEARFGGVG